MEEKGKREPAFWVISHTHWDREWYMPLEQMKIRLVSLFDRLLKILDMQPDYVFHMDAQTIVLEDYLEIRPDNREKVERYIREGRMLVGPWYVQNDFYLSSGEATVRNLLIGSKIAERFGRCGKVGYCPDQFGNIAQLPQIFQEFGIETCVFGRGYNKQPQPVQEFFWKSENGSQVLCSYMTHWYNNAQRFSENIDRSMQMVNFIKENIDKVSLSSQYLLMNGVDHLEAQDNLLPILKEVQKRLPKGQKIFQGDLEGYMKALREDLEGKKLDTVVGEMRDGNKWNVLAGTLSSRIYLKQSNDFCQMLLERQLEPLFAALSALGVRRYPAEYLEYLWKTLLQNLAHDSICGCSVDAVNRHMEDRYERIKEGASMMLESGMDTLQEYISRAGLPKESYLFTLFNPLQSERSELVEAFVDILEEEDLGAVQVLDFQGRPVKYQILGRERKARGLVSPINLPGVINVISYRVQLEVENLPGASYRTYQVLPAKEGVMPQPRRGEVLENEFLRAEICEDGTLELFNKRLGKSWIGAFEITDTADVGDSYIFLPSTKDVPISSRTGRTGAVVRKWLQNDEMRQQLRLSITLLLPEMYDFAKGQRSDKLVECPIELTFTLDRMSSFLKADISFTNRAKDHRLRVKFPVEAGDISFSGNPFDCCQRSRTKAHSGFAIGDQPFSEFVGSGDLTIFGEGLHEYEHTEDNALEVTILRSTGYITRDVNQESLVEDKWKVPENQNLGSYQVQMAVCPGLAPNEGGAQLARVYNTPLIQGYQPYDEKKFTGGRPFVQGTDTPEFFYIPKEFPEVSLPGEQEIFHVEGAAAVLSAWKLSKGKLLLRFYSVSPKEEHLRVSFTKEPKAVYRGTLAEGQEERLPVEKSAFELKTAPKGIDTLLISL